MNYSKIHKLLSCGIRSKVESQKTWLYSAYPVFFSLILLHGFLLISPNPLFVAASSLFIGIFHSFISAVGLLTAGFLGYLSHHPLVLPPFHHEIGLLEVFVLFRLSYLHLMWKRLGRKPSLMRRWLPLWSLSFQGVSWGESGGNAILD